MMDRNALYYETYCIKSIRKNSVLFLIFLDIFIGWLDEKN